MFVRETKPLIDEQYVKTGKVYFVFRDLPLSAIHPGALLAAHAANCAAEQGQFWPMHDRLYAGQAAGEWGSGDLHDLQIFVNYARALQIDAPTLQACVTANRQVGQIEYDLRAAADKGLNSTPAFLVNGRPFLGARPFSSWKQLFDSLLTQ